ncbi:MAG: MBL fold metallo-hydrolase [Solirubrobacteraceae bacterium]
MEACIHRGAREVGGSCVELRAGEWRLVLDVGLPLEPPPPGEETLLPEIPGLADGVGDKTAVVVSHGHPDHHGLLDQTHPKVPLFMGAAANRILREAAFFTGATAPRPPTRPLKHLQPIEFGPFHLTPYLADHSGFDAYSLLVEADGRRLFYTGDLRAHGRKPQAFHQLIDHPPGNVEVLLLEGTHVRAEPSPAGQALSEEGVEHQLTELCRETDGAVLACYSPQNVDRLVSLFKAARRTGRELVMDLYAATIARATGRSTIPVPGWEGVRVYLPDSQRRKVIDSGEFWRTDEVRTHRIYSEELGECAGRLVLTFRGSMRREFERAGCLDGARCVWSMWWGYLERERGRDVVEWLDQRQIPLEAVHASGHATLVDLQRLAAAIAARRLVPVHTGAPDRFPSLFENVESREDGEWWDV